MYNPERSKDGAQRQRQSDYYLPTAIQRQKQQSSIRSIGYLKALIFPITTPLLLSSYSPVLRSTDCHAEHILLGSISNKSEVGV